MEQAWEPISSTAYDPLNRLTAFRRGTLSSSGNNGSTLDTITTASATNSWTLNALGDSTSTGGVSRTVNSKNQITAISGLTSPTYDHDGNTTTDQAGNTYSYDAWNRLVFVNLPGLSTNENYTYSAGGARPGISVCNGAVTTSYYSTNWQDLEDDVVTSGPTTTKNTYLWSEAYIDELVARDTSVNGGGVTRTFAQQDANHDVTSLVNSSGTVLERFIYDPYGKQTVLNASWSTTSDSYNWVYGFQGGRLDPLTGLVNFRNRDLNPVTGTWMEQDPAGYVDGADLYQFVMSDPTSFLDPSGLSSDAELKQHLNATDLDSKKPCSVELYAHDAFGGGFGYHLGMQINTKNGHYRVELLGFNDENKSYRIGSGPAGLFGIPSSGGSAASSTPSTGKIFRGDPNNAYGTFIVPHSMVKHNWKYVEDDPAIDASPVSPPAGECPCKFSDDMLAAAHDVANRWNNQEKKVVYDFLWHNSNTFIGQIVRSGGGSVTYPSVPGGAPAYDD